MNCTKINQHLEARLDAELDPRLERVVDAHLAACPSCRAAFDQSKALKGMLRESLPCEPSVSLDDRVMRAFDRHHAPQMVVAAEAGWRPRLSGSVGVSVPALALALVLIASSLLAAVKLGSTMATQIVVMSPAAPTSGVTAPRTIEVPIESERIARVPVTARRTAAPSPVRGRRADAPPPPAKKSRAPGKQPLQSSTVVSATEADYSTTAALKGFEPLTGSTVRVIKGAEER